MNAPKKKEKPLALRPTHQEKRREKKDLPPRVTVQGEKRSASIFKHKKKEKKATMFGRHRSKEKNEPTVKRPVSPTSRKIEQPPGPWSDLGGKRGTIAKEKKKKGKRGKRSRERDVGGVERW